MQSHITNYHQIAEDLRKTYTELTMIEALNLAVQIERNQILENAFSVSRNDSHPPSLEAIAISLGYDDVRSNLVEAIHQIADKK